MVHAKKKSGDPDYDDKVPLDEQLHERVTGPNGEEIVLTDTVGPTLPDGSHAALDEEPDDNRPADGGVAKKSSTVQVAESPSPARKSRS